MKVNTLLSVSDASDVAGRLGPRPTPLHHDPTTQLSSARAAVLDALVDVNGSATVHQLAQALGQHPNTVREHLDALVDLELASRVRGRPAGRGRPAIRYEAVAPERSRPQLREYATLATVLAEQLAAVSRDPVGDAIAAGHRWGERLGTRGPEGATAARNRTLAILDSLGFEPTESPDGSFDLLSCPMLQAAIDNPSIVCGVHLGLVQSLYRGHEAPAHDVELEPFARPGSCRLRLPADEPRALPPGPSTPAAQDQGHPPGAQRPLDDRD